MHVLETSKGLLSQHEGERGKERQKQKQRVEGSLHSHLQGVIHSEAGEYGDFFDPKRLHRNFPVQSLLWPSKWGIMSHSPGGLRCHFCWLDSLA